MKIIKKVFFILLLFALQEMYAAPAEITIRVIDSESKEPLENVMVSIPQIDYSGFSGNDGKIEVKDIEPSNYHISFRRIGYLNENSTLCIVCDSSRAFTFELIEAGLSSPTVVVTGKKKSTQFERVVEESRVLEGRELQNKLSQSLASTLKNETGVAVRSMGPAPARPVIRGLGGSRISINEDDMQTKDLSASSPDHAVTIEPVLADRIEIIRGPRSLLFTTNAIGGVVNVVEKTIPDNIPDDILFNGTTYYETANRGYLAAGEISIPVENFALKAAGSFKEASDLSSPDKILKNTGLQTHSYHAGASFIDRNFTFGASFREFSTDYGIPGGFVGAHPKGVNIEMLKRDINAKAKFHFHGKNFDNLELDIKRSYYRHVEYESNGSVGSEFVIRNYGAKLNLNQMENKLFDKGTIGISFDYKSTKLGGLVFSPPNDAITLSTYIFEEFHIDDLYFQIGGRYSFDNYKPDPESIYSQEEGIEEKNFHSLSFSLSAMKEVFPETYLGAIVSRTSRPPSTQELFNQGPHLAAYSYEVGNPLLEGEYGWGFEIFSKYHSGPFKFMISAFWNEMPYFISHRNSGQINYSLQLPIYRAIGIEARLRGIEIESDIELPWNLKAALSGSYTHGENLTDDIPLPEIPPLKGMMEISHSQNNLTFGLRSEFAASQDRTDEFEIATDGYVIFGLYGYYAFNLGKYANSVSLNIDNLFNTTFRNHLSRIRSIMPEPGTNLRIMYRFFM